MNIETINNENEDMYKVTIKIVDPFVDNIEDSQFTETEYKNKEELMKDLDVLLKPSLFGNQYFRIVIEGFSNK